MRRPSSKIAAKQSNNRSCERCRAALLSQNIGPGRPPRYCDQCRPQRRSKQTQQLALTCRFCAREFHFCRRGRGRLPGFCSPKCRSRAGEAGRTRLKRTCTQCAGKFVTVEKTQRCCSPACGRKARDATRAAKSRAGRRRTCETCGATFTMRHHLSGKALRGEVREGLFCSRPCQATRRRAMARERLAIRDLFCEA